MATDDEWISVEDALPEAQGPGTPYSRFVLVFDGEGKWVAFYDWESESWCVGNGLVSSCLSGPITHWHALYLPENPAVATDGE
jgi:hypothetical protein